MKCAVLPAGRLRANCCVLSDGGGNAAVVDPGGDFPVIRRYLEDNGLSVGLILLTHGHPDHTGALEPLKRLTGARVCVHRDDAYRLETEPDFLLSDGDVLECGELRFSVLHTPGHTEGSVCYLTDGLILSGDTLFRGSVGRTDLPGGDWDTEMASLKKLTALPCDGSTVIPGHGGTTTLEYEREFNPYLT